MATIAHSYLMTFFDGGEPRSDITASAKFYTLPNATAGSQAAESTAVVAHLESDIENAAVQIDVVAASRTITADSAGGTVNFTSLGFAVGDWVTGAGFTNAGNNFDAAKITAIGSAGAGTDNVLTLEDRVSLALADETGSGNEVITKLVPGTFRAYGLPTGPGVLIWTCDETLSGDSSVKSLPVGPMEPYAAVPVLQALRSQPFAVGPGTIGGAIIAGAERLFSRIENHTLGTVNGETVLTSADIVYYEDDTFSTEILRTRHTPTYDASSAVLTASRNEVV